MNLLAHSYLSYNNDEILVGNMIGDFVKGNIDKLNYPPRIKKGLKLHRIIDAFTESNEHSIRSKRRLHPKYGLYRGIMVDVFYDHFLAKNWKQYSNIELLDYTLNVYDILNKYKNIFPNSFIFVLDRMSKNNWLYSYKDIDTIDIVLKRIGNYRIKRKNNLKLGISELKNHYNELEDDFIKFFEEIRLFLNKKCE